MRGKDVGAEAPGAESATGTCRTVRRAPRSPAGVAWIVVVGVLLAGIVAVNVLVLQLNMQFDGLSRERAQLKADNARLRSQLSSASANVRIEAGRHGRARPRAADPLTTTYVRLGEVSDRRANRRIRLLLAAFALLFARRDRPGRVGPGRPARAATRRWRSRSIARRSRCRRGAERSTTGPASRSRSASRRRRSTPIRGTSPTPNGRPWSRARRSASTPTRSTRR